MVPEGKKRAFGLPNIVATRASKALTEGSSAYTSSPSLAVIIASIIPFEGFVTVSLLKSICMNFILDIKLHIILILCYKFYFCNSKKINDNTRSHKRSF